MSKTFSQVVADQRRGLFSDQAGDKFAELVTAVRATGKPAELIIKLAIKPNQQPGAVTVTDEIIAKAPKIDKAADFFFADDQGTLLRQDPNQPDLPGIRAIDNTKRETVYVPVDRTTGEVLQAPVAAQPAAIIPAKDAAQLAQAAQTLGLQSVQVGNVDMSLKPAEPVPPAADAAAA